MTPYVVADENIPGEVVQAVRKLGCKVYWIAAEQPDKVGGNLTRRNRIRPDQRGAHDFDASRQALLRKQLRRREVGNHHLNPFAARLHSCGKLKHLRRIATMTEYKTDEDYVMKHQGA